MGVLLNQTKKPSARKNVALETQHGELGMSVEQTKKELGVSNQKKKIKEQKKRKKELRGKSFSVPHSKPTPLKRPGKKKGKKRKKKRETARTAGTSESLEKERSP